MRPPGTVLPDLPDGSRWRVPRIGEPSSRPIEVAEPRVTGQRIPVHTTESKLDQEDLDVGQGVPGYRVGRDDLPDEPVQPPRGGRILRRRVGPRRHEVRHVFNQLGKPVRDPTVADWRSDSKDSIGSAPASWNKACLHPSCDAHTDLPRLGLPKPTPRRDAESNQEHFGGDRVGPDQPDQRHRVRSRPEEGRTPKRIVSAPLRTSVHQLHARMMSIAQLHFPP